MLETFHPSRPLVRLSALFLVNSSIREKLQQGRERENRNDTTVFREEKGERSLGGDEKRET